MNQTPHALILPLLMVATSTSFVAAGDETTTIIKDAPDRDRWMYPFNASPGTRPAASIFGYATAIEAPFDNRDGQFVIGFDTDGDLAPGTANDYQVVSAKVTIQLSNQGHRLRRNDRPLAELRRTRQSRLHRGFGPRPADRTLRNRLPKWF